MIETEGVIKFRYTRRPGPPAGPQAVAVLQGWRAVLRRLGLIGQDPARYGGVGFGNLSRRLDASEGGGFLVTGSGTGGLERLGPRHYVRVIDWSLAENEVDSIGETPPSSESMTHAAVYQAAPWVRWVFHVHCPEIWERAPALGLPATPAEVAYGTPAMAEAVSALLDGAGPAPAVVAMAGHRDGVIAVAATAEAAGSAVVSALADALTPRSRTADASSP